MLRVVNLGRAGVALLVVIWWIVNTKTRSTKPHEITKGYNHSSGKERRTKETLAKLKAESASGNTTNAAQAVKIKSVMPPTCSGETHACSYGELHQPVWRCHRLARWSIHAFCYGVGSHALATKREPPRDKPVASKLDRGNTFCVAASVSLPRASRGHH